MRKSLHTCLMKSRTETCQAKDVMKKGKKIQKYSKYSPEEVHELKEVVKLPDT